MQTMTININEKFTLTKLDTAFSLRPFINFLKKSLKNDSSLKDKLTAFLLEKMEQFPELEGDIPVENMDKYRDILELIFVSMSNVTEDETRLPMVAWYAFAAIVCIWHPGFLYINDRYQESKDQESGDAGRRKGNEAA